MNEWSVTQLKLTSRPDQDNHTVPNGEDEVKSILLPKSLVLPPNESCFLFFKWSKVMVLELPVEDQRRRAQAQRS